MPSDKSADGARNDAIIAAVRDLTHHLLGRTIAFSVDEWAEPTRLPGWTRSHVAAHLVHNARQLLARINGEEAAGDAAADAHALGLAALSDGLSLQIDLDTTAGELDQAMATLDEDSDIPLERLLEVVLHSYDMDPDANGLHIDPESAVELLAFRIRQIGSRPDAPHLLLMSDEGPATEVGQGGEPTLVMGPASDLLLWLTRGVLTSRLSGATDV